MKKFKIDSRIRLYILLIVVAVFLFGAYSYISSTGNLRYGQSTVCKITLTPSVTNPVIGQSVTATIGGLSGCTKIKDKTVYVKIGSCLGEQLCKVTLDSKNAGFCKFTYTKETSTKLLSYRKIAACIDIADPAGFAGQGEYVTTPFATSAASCTLDQYKGATFTVNPKTNVKKGAPVTVYVSESSLCTLGTVREVSIAGKCKGAEACTLTKTGSGATMNDYSCTLNPCTSGTVKYEYCNDRNKDGKFVNNAANGNLEVLEATVKVTSSCVCACDLDSCILG